ncbi:uncharacterized protein LOC114937677 [Nylanderia fulva]|uniref:uncharacterized protein LOC114937677 n=1 Tax=Nylanderia fulva TaxID=613905 RepID=UPI0010FBB03A|nr:uncharacterized protein LOC114937677 [Nylanderia fulva]
MSNCKISQSQALYKVIEGADRNPIFNAEMSEVYLRDNKTGRMAYIPLTEYIIETLLKPYGIEIMLPEKNVDTENSSRCSTSILEETENIILIPLEESNEKVLDKGMKNLWTDKSRAMLLHLYKKYQNDFSSNCIKKDDIWTKIACGMKCEGYNFVAAQCKEKMKYMKKKYFKKIDNMGPKSTGAAPVKCDNFEELDELFGNKPNVIPVAIASSSNDNIKFEVTQKDLDDAKDNKKKQRKRASTITLSDLQVILEDKETQRRPGTKKNKNFFDKV